MYLEHCFHELDWTQRTLSYDSVLNYNSGRQIRTCEPLSLFLWPKSCLSEKLMAHCWKLMIWIKYCSWHADSWHQCKCNAYVNPINMTLCLTVYTLIIYLALICKLWIIFMQMALWPSVEQRLKTWPTIADSWVSFVRAAPECSTAEWAVSRRATRAASTVELWRERVHEKLAQHVLNQAVVRGVSSDAKCHLTTLLGKFVPPHHQIVMSARAEKCSRRTSVLVGS